MNNKRTLYGVELRYVLTFHLSQYGRTTVGDLIEALEYYNPVPPRTESAAA